MFGRIRSTAWGEAGNIAAQGLRSSFILSLVLFPILTGLSLFLEYRFLQPVGRLDYLSAAWYLAFADAFKLTYTLYARYRLHGAHSVSYIPYSGSVDEERSDERSSAHTGGGRHWVLAACGIGTLWTLLGYANISAHNLPYSSQSVSAAAGPSALIVLFLQAASLFRRLSQTYYQALILQFAGILIMGTALHTQFTIHMLALTVLTATISVAIESCYKLCLPVTFHDINALSFAVGIVIHLIVVISQFLMSSNFVPTGFLSTTLLILPLRGIVDIWALSLIYEYDSLVQRVLSGLGYSGFLLSLPRSTKPTIIFGFAISFWATFSFIFSELGISFEAGGTNTRTEPREKPREPRSRQLGWLSILVLLTSIAWFSLLPASLSSRNALAQDLGFTGPTRTETSLPISRCQFRKPLAFPPSSRVPYHHFDDILLIVFFSHARYDVNLDHYRAVYADYFPNVVFVGPKSREDQGFLHSYDILVDSYQSDEDLKDDKNYKMAGRMAHHMFYTALQEYPCYSGYLWAPFDTFLNIPRLEKFDQNRVWYHSPFAKYVPNIALGGDEENSDPERHPPPAIISPDPFLNLTKDWRGWGPDWWWGDPHVGLAECMPAFLKTPESQRKRLENYFDGKTRFIGGSVDTLYIPGRHRESLMATLSLFLETNCFLEIALPTALHLIIPWDEDILFVDHHWIWTPPMNPDFVRQQWHEGKEVDTFHTFHWGDKQADGIWRGDPRLIDDTRAVLQESAARQRTVLPKLVD